MGKLVLIRVELDTVLALALSNPASPSRKVLSPLALQRKKLSPSNPNKWFETSKQSQDF